MRIEFPGLFDLQINGFSGVDFNSPATTSDDVFRTIERIRATGVTRFLPTLITSPIERFASCASVLTHISRPAIAGLHMEGPYIVPEDGPRGAHLQEYVTRPTIDDFQRRQEAAGGQIRLVTLAPEIPGAMRLIEHLVAHGVRAAIGHTAATPVQIRDAVRAGATLSTHLGNGCASLLQRHPNFIWEQLAEEGLFASFIVDGHHLDPATVKSMIRAKTPDRSILVTDAVAAAGCSPGKYELNGEAVVLNEDGRVTSPGKPWLAGSSLTLDRALSNTAKFTGLPVEVILPMASSQPAAYLGIQTIGRVTADWDATACRLTNLKVLES